MTEQAPAHETPTDELTALLTEAFAGEIRAMAGLLLSKTGRQTFGATEFQLRDLVHRLGAKALETALGQKKTATTAPR
jgi:hypothetical protein